MCSMHNHTTLSISTLLQAGEASVGWALGYILSVSSLLPEEPAGIRKGLCPAAWICLLILLTVLLTATVCYMALLVIRRKRRNGGVSQHTVILLFSVLFFCLGRLILKYAPQRRYVYLNNAFLYTVCDNIASILTKICLFVLSLTNSY